jgi:hypothetical protein
MNEAPRPDAPEEEQGGGWYKTIFNALMIYFAFNAVTSFLGGRLGGQKDNSSDGTVKTGAVNRAPESIPAFWPLGTKMVLERVIWSNGRI